ncbi:hypothetical protein [Aeromicrobium chenweiae]|uniref:Uncharacterized protein n=1 Tax=Aeromicrobium chenweiae TaxID=2079793 RepID=A0A2S0WKF0_9ACTN|nr:hypothetical protein [Aeromicrobium chenweiae]AWB91744.1 hypothetical protein C3E78_05715 [Aeromicrobium chenweiae]TGN32586.1 hypothetical protein E4L97_07675 [Aeromicrobium chenweiae]
MKALINILLGLLLVGVVAAIVLFFTTRANEKEEDAAPPRVEKVVHMSTGGVVANIERRLEAKTGFPLTVRCPKKVDQSIGTTFRCSVRREGGEDRIAIAKVRIRGAGGQFGWTSTPVPTPKASEDPAA